MANLPLIDPTNHTNLFGWLVPQEIIGKSQAWLQEAFKAWPIRMISI